MYLNVAKEVTSAALPSLKVEKQLVNYINQLVKVKYWCQSNNK